MIVNGFIEPVTKELPMEYAVELNRLIQLEMVGSSARRRRLRAPVDTIAAPLFPHEAAVGEHAGRARQVSIIQRGRPMLVEFWDFCRPNSMRTLPYVKAWHERYAEDGLRVIGVHSPGLRASREEDAVRAAVARLGIELPGADRQRAGAVAATTRTRAGRRATCSTAARGCSSTTTARAATSETERAIQELLGVEREPLAPLRPEDAPGAALAAPTPEQPAPTAAAMRPAACGPCSTARERARERPRDAARAASWQIAAPGAYPLLEHERHTTGELDARAGRRRALPGDVLHARRGLRPAA